MTFKQRLPYFLGGLFIGVIIVVFILRKKETTFDYGPNARVLKNISIKQRVFSKQASAALQLHKIDTASISIILKNGDVDIWNKIKLNDSCIVYAIDGTKELKHLQLIVKNCPDIALIEKISVK